MNWYLQSGKDSDIAKETKIKFLRNIVGYPFNLKTEEQRESFENKIKENLYNIGYGLKFLRLEDMDKITITSLVEKGLIDSKFALNKNGSILINDDENICIIIGKENHFEIQVFNCGMCLEETLNLAIELDERINEVLGYAVSKKYGYLTAYPTDVGTGLKASVILHLPALETTGNASKILSAIGNFGVSIKKVSTGLYQILNRQTLGVTEKEIIEIVKIIANRIIEQERKSRKMLADNTINFEDIVYRSYGILSNCRKISNDETKKLLSNIKLGVDLGILDKVTDSEVQKLYLYTEPANLQKYLKEEYSSYELDIKRAEVIRKILNK